MKSRFKSRLGFIAAVLVAWAIASAWLPPLVAQQPAQAPDAFRRVSDKLICQCGCNYILTNCPHLECPSAPTLRATIRQKLAAGLSEQQVIDAMVAQFGPAILAQPPAKGFNLTAWVMPFIGLLLGFWIVQGVVRRWRRREAPPAADPAVVERYRSQLEKEVKRLEEE